MDWFRSHHGAPIDPKWIVIAKRAVTHCNTESVTPGHVAAVWWYMMDYASQNSPRGSVEGIDLEVLAAAYGWSLELVTAIDQALHDKQLIDAQGVLNAWDSRNPKREDDSAERVRKHRESKRTVTQCNADETQSNSRGEESRGDKRIDNEQRNSASIEAGASSDDSFQQNGDNSPPAPRKQHAPAHGATPNVGRLMQLIRDGDPAANPPVTGLYVDKQPPKGRTEAQDADTLDSWIKAGRDPAQIEMQIIGLSMMRDAGKLKYLKPGHATSLGMLSVVKDLARDAETYFLRNAKPK